MGRVSITCRSELLYRLTSAHLRLASVPGTSPRIVSSAACRRISDTDLPVRWAKSSILVLSRSETLKRIDLSFTCTPPSGFHRGRSLLGLLHVGTRAWLATAGHSKISDYKR
jgi:hypothetical protein